MGNVNRDSPDLDKAGENRLRGRSLEGAELDQAVDHARYAKRRNPDTELRTDGEADSLYDDGLDVEDDSRPLTGINGDDDSHRG
jgi:hypothetical protein